MSLLLDTHALLWYILDDPKLSSHARERIQHEKETVWVSPASLWELAIKISLGKYQLDLPFEPFITEQLAANRFTLLPINVQHAGVVAKLPFHHRDPFDRLIIAQSLVEQLPLVSVDAQFAAYGVEQVW